MSNQTMNELRALDDPALNRVVLERLGYTAHNYTDEDTPPFYVLLRPDGLLSVDPQRRIDFDPFDYEEHGWPEGWRSDDNGYYTIKHGWSSEESAFSVGPQYVTDLNLAWALRPPDRYWIVEMDGEDVVAALYDGDPLHSRIYSRHTRPARAIVLAWLAMKMGANIDE